MQVLDTEFDDGNTLTAVPAGDFKKSVDDAACLSLQGHMGYLLKIMPGATASPSPATLADVLVLSEEALHSFALSHDGKRTSTVCKLGFD